jgi:GT2 family glycosyltransferase
MVTRSDKCFVAILIVCHNGREHLEDCLSSVQASDDGELSRHIVVVNNGSKDGSREFLRDRFPEVEVIDSTDNLGFAAGNNLGRAVIKVRHPEVSFLTLLNQDTRVASGWLRPLVEFLREHPEVGAVQPKLMLYAEPARINTLGNMSHFLGFGFLKGYGEPERERYQEPMCITFASGAAVMLRTELLEQVGLFDEEFFAYLEDADICWALRQIGFSTYLVPASIVYHKYAATAPYRHYYLLERNRYMLLFKFYKIRTLLLLAPALWLMEIGQWLFAVQHGLLHERWRVVCYFLRPANILRLWNIRIVAQTRRMISDHEFLHDFCGVIEVKATDNPLMRYIGNPVLGRYWSLAKRLITW